jgi:hypothetical protein
MHTTSTDGPEPISSMKQPGEKCDIWWVRLGAEGRRVGSGPGWAGKWQRGDVWGWGVGWEWEGREGGGS